MRKGSAHRKAYTKVRVLFFALILLMFICLVTVTIGKHTVKATEPESYKYYTHITVEAGDTLWDIAGRYMGHEYKSRKAYIEEVQSINHLSTDRIYADTTIVVPYYDTVIK